ncbi:MAG TPA: dihydropteroate synthase [Microthrixaceae bacterium]|nr:dihydropteroate synthase [Microthrixaceae bacterium]
MALVMGVLNVTPDSFSDGGEHLAPERAVERAARMIEEGAAWIDVGGESTRPGALPVDPDEERRRVLPVLDAIVPLARAAGVGVSIDTRNEATARAAVAHGAALINDVAATLWPVAAELGVGWVAMHMLGDPRTMQRSPRYGDVVDEVRRFLVERATAAREAGVPEVWVDPGIGFGKTTTHNLQLLARLEVLVAEGFDVLVGTSRKRFTGELVGRSDARVGAGREGIAPLEDRLEGSVGTAVWAIRKGAAMVRAHDVAATVRAAAVAGGRVDAP